MKHTSFVYTFFAHPITNIPPVINSGICIANNGVQNIVLGYKTSDTRKLETLANGCKIFRIELRSRKISIAPLRKILSTIEFIFSSRKIINKKKPSKVILFNEIACIIGRFIKKTRQVHWVLEFPENSSGIALEDHVKKMAYKSWTHADILIFPSNCRKAMSMVLNPAILHKKMLVIHNSPLLHAQPIADYEISSEEGQQAISFINKCRAEKKIVIIYAGAVGNRYGWDSLIKSVGNIQDQFALLILGTKHELGHNEFNQALNGCHYPDNILWVNAISYKELQQVINKGDIGFVHYRGDTLNTYFSAPGKLYEYLKAGLAILTDKNTCISEDLEATNSAITFNVPLSDNVLTEILKNITVNEINQKKQNARELFMNRYSFENQTTALLNYIKNGNEK